ncbi:MAG: hypothetical protein GY870_18675 [archaeon]|nr:hypothetical protein [archaeon]
MKKILIIILCLIPIFAAGKRKHHESYYQEKFCAELGGMSEITMQNKTRCDCITRHYAIEFDFANKFYEAIGQSLDYSISTGKLPGIVLILENKKDLKYWKRLNNVINYHELLIRTWKIENFK